jgi:hypothetical protein
MATGENSKLDPQAVDKLFDEAVSAYQKRDYFQARELLKIVVEENPLFSSNDRRASDLLADVEFQLAEKASIHRKNRILGGLSIFLGICALVMMIFLIFSTIKGNQLQKSNATSNATLAAQTSLLHSADITVTAASERAEFAQATMTTMRQNPASAQATIQAYENLAASGSLSNQPIYGPTSGQLYHDGSGFVISEDAGVDIKNMIIQARFVNPYGSDEYAFDYGFFFRDTGGDHQFRLAVNSDATWNFDFVDDPTWDSVDSGTLVNFDASAGGRNTIKLVILDDRALFYVNDDFITALTTQAKLVSGDIFIVSASFEDHEIVGRSTGYEDFTIQPLP